MDSRPRSRTRALAFVGAALAVYALHVALLLWFLPPEYAFGEAALTGHDLSTHLAQTRRVVEGLDGWGQTWVYDVQLLAGFPNGTIFDADNKAWELWTYAAVRCGLSFERGFNSFVLVTHLLAPICVGACAWLFGLGRWQALLAAALTTGLWYFDSFTHWCWFVGMVEYDLAAFLALIPLALFYRFMSMPKLGTKPKAKLALAAATALTLGLTLTVHPYVFVILVAPMLWLWLRDAAQQAARTHLLVVGIVVVAVAMNLWWLRVAFEFWHYIADSAYFGQADLSYLVADLLGTLVDTETTGSVGTRATLRLLVVVAAIVQIRRWAKRDDSRGGLFAVALGSLLALTYLGGYVGVIAQLQPFRFVVPTGFLATIPAAAFAFEFAAELRESALDHRAKLLVLLLAIPAFQQLAADVLYFIPELRRQPPPLYNGEPAMLTGSGYVGQLAMRYRIAPDDEDLVEFVDGIEDGRGRWLVEWPPLADELSARTDAQVIGGLPVLNLDHAQAHLWRRYPDGVVDPDVFRAYLETYAISWVVITAPTSYFKFEPNPWLDLVAIRGIHRVYRTKLAVKLIAKGGGKARASTNSIRVTGSKPHVDVVLRYHWLETLVCAPDCVVERTEVDGVDPVGFIRVPAPHPSDFEISNGY